MDLYESIYEPEDTERQELPQLYELFAYSAPQVTGGALDDTLVVTTNGADHLVISLNGADNQTLDINGFNPAEDSVSVLLNGAPAPDVTFADEMLRVGGDLIAVIRGADEVLIH